LAIAISLHVNSVAKPEFTHLPALRLLAVGNLGTFAEGEVLAPFFDTVSKLKVRRQRRGDASHPSLRETLPWAHIPPSPMFIYRHRHTKVGEISDIVVTDSGCHIIKRTA
jgi:hypothetical protein